MKDFLGKKIKSIEYNDVSIIITLEDDSKIDVWYNYAGIDVDFKYPENEQYEVDFKNIPIEDF